MKTKKRIKRLERKMQQVTLTTIALMRANNEQADKIKALGAIVFQLDKQCVELKELNSG